MTERSEREHRRQRRAVIARVLVVTYAAICLHILILVALHPLVSRTTDPGEGSDPIALMVLPSEAMDTEPPPEEEEELPEEEPERDPHGQIVEVAEPDDQQAPDESSFLAEHDRTVDQETRTDFLLNPEILAEQRTEESPSEAQTAHDAEEDVEEQVPEEELAEEEVLEEDVAERDEPEVEEVAERDEPEVEEVAELDEPEVEEVAELDEPELPDADAMEPLTDPDDQDAELEATEPERFDPRRHGTHSSLPSHSPSRPGEAAPSSQAAPGEEAPHSGAPQNDLLDVDRGDRTALNTHQFRYASYLNRVRQLVSHHWNQNLANLPPGVKLARPKYVTVVHVVLDDAGDLQAISVAEQSGSSELDACVVEAFEMAGPFPTPPDGLVAQDGHVYLPEMSFTVPVGRARRPYQAVDPRAGAEFPGLLRSPRAGDR